jgi:hypothetical protein
MVDLPVRWSLRAPSPERHQSDRPGGSIGNPEPDWHIVGTGDFNHDGKSDVLWQNSSGAVSVWEMNGTSLSAAAILANPGPTGHI